MKLYRGGRVPALLAGLYAWTIPGGAKRGSDLETGVELFMLVVIQEVGKVRRNIW